MARPATGQIVERRGKDGRVYRSLRFRANGRRHTLPLGAVSRDEAARQLAYVLADVARGTWQAPAPTPEPHAEVPTFHAYAEQWWLRNAQRLGPGTQVDYRARLERHLLPYFAERPLDAITFDTVEDYIASKLAENERIRKAAADGTPLREDITDKRGRTVARPMQPLSPRRINMGLVLLGAIMETAVERDLIRRNPAKGKGRRLRERGTRRSYLESPEQIEALLHAAGQLDGEAASNRRHVHRRAMLATLTFAGLRIGELLRLRWRDVDLAGGWLTVQASKTDAGRRKVKIRGALRDELLAVRTHVEPDGIVFATSTGRRLSAENFRNRVLTAAVKRADENLTEQDLPPIPAGITPHSLRRTFASLLYAVGESPRTVMDELGHTDEGLALRVYAQTMRSDEDERARLRTLIEGPDWANMGERGDLAEPQASKREAA